MPQIQERAPQIQKRIPQVPKKIPQKETPPEKLRRNKRGEIILLKANRSRSIFLKWYLISILLLIIFGILYLRIFDITTLGVPEEYFNFLLILPSISILIMIIHEIKIRILLESYVLTEGRVIMKTGTFNKYETSLEYEMMSHYQIRQSFRQRIFNCGTIEVQSVAGTAKPEMVLIEVANLSKAKKIIDKNMLRKKGIY